MENAEKVRLNKLLKPFFELLEIIQESQKATSSKESYLAEKEKYVECKANIAEIKEILKPKPNRPFWRGPGKV